MHQSSKKEEPNNKHSNRNSVFVNPHIGRYSHFDNSKNRNVIRLTTTPILAFVHSLNKKKLSKWHFVSTENRKKEEEKKTLNHSINDKHYCIVLRFDLSKKGTDKRQVFDHNVYRFQILFLHKFFLDLLRKVENKTIIEKLW